MVYDLFMRIAVDLFRSSESFAQLAWHVWRSSFVDVATAPPLSPALINIRQKVAGDSPQTRNDLVKYDANRGAARAPMRCQMYNLLKAKEEIDAVAKHTIDLATHVLSMGDNFDHKLESFKKEILGAIDAKFADLERTIVGGEHQNIETSTMSDLGAKMSQLLHGAQPSPVDTFIGHHGDPHPHPDNHGYSDNQGYSDNHGHTDHSGDSGYHDDGHGHHN